MNTINRGLWVNETNDAYEMRVKNSCFNARANIIIKGVFTGRSLYYIGPLYYYY